MANKKSKTVLNSFFGTVNKSKRKPNKLRVNQGRKFYNNFLQKFLDDNDILICLTYNEGNSVVADRFIRILKSMLML